MTEEPAKKIQVSIVIPTLNRHVSLQNVIRDLNLQIQERPDIEILIVDQSEHVPSDFSEAVAAYPPRVQWHPVSFRNLPKARNYGIRESLGEIILFLDDDVKLSPGFLEGHIKSYEDAEVAGVTGPVLYHEDEKLGPPRILLPEDARKIEQDTSEIWKWNCRYDAMRVKGCNMSFRKEWILKAGGFDESFYGAAIGEDYDMGLRIRRLGGRLVYEPRACVFHYELPSGGCRDLFGSFQYAASYTFCNFRVCAKNREPFYLCWEGAVSVIRTLLTRKTVLQKPSIFFIHLSGILWGLCQAVCKMIKH